MSCDHIIGPARLLLEASSDPIVLFKHPVWTAPLALLSRMLQTPVMCMVLLVQGQWLCASQLRACQALRYKQQLVFIGPFHDFYSHPTISIAALMS